jgi:hypothetical protein
MAAVDLPIHTCKILLYKLINPALKDIIYVNSYSSTPAHWLHLYKNVDKFYILFLSWVNRIIMFSFVVSLVLLIIESLSLNRL